jgi:hypothetical protein
MPAVTRARKPKRPRIQVGQVTERQRALARHALGFPNNRNTSYRNHFCAGPGHDDYDEWLQMVAEGLAIKQTGPYWGGDDMFHLTLKAALLAREPKEHLSREDTASMREMELPA